MRFARHIQAIKFSFEYRVAARIQKSSRETAINSLGATILLLQHSVTKVSCRCCHVTHKSKAKVKVCTEAKLNGRKRVLIVGGINTMQYCESVQVIDSLTFVF